MTGPSIYALSNIADARAIAALERLASDPYDPRQKPYVREALIRNQRVLERGWISVRAAARMQFGGAE
jgi:HEAT repeat protein